MKKSNAAENSATHFLKTAEVAENYSLQKTASVAESSASLHIRKL